ncbi:ATP-dependent Clp protease ATP-binding subunit [Pseudomonadota bacterium]
MFDPNKLTQKAQQTLANSLQKATTSNHLSLEDFHLLWSLATTEGIAQEILTKLTVIDNLTSDLEKKLSQLPTTTDTSTPQIGSEAAKILNLATKIAHNYNDDFVPQEVLLLATIQSTGGLKDIISSHNLSKDQIKTEIDKARQGTKTDSPTSDTTYNVLEKYTVDLTARARDGKLDPVIGRDAEIRRVMQVLSRRTKNNPVLIGDPGVGKTAIVEGLAQRIISGDIPESLKHKQLLVLDIASVLAGAKFRGEFEERLKSVLKSITSNPDKYIIFLDELHTIVGAGASEGAVDASNMLKPGLARGELHVIGATTINEYRKYIEKDAALERRFQPVTINEPSPEDSLAILRGLKEKYELHHGVGIADEALVTAVTLSNRYISDRFLPDKAIDLLDEATSSIKIESQSKPESLDTLNRKITQLEIEKKALKTEKNKQTKEKITLIDKELADHKEKAKVLESRWQAQKTQLDQINQIREEIDKLKLKLEEAERSVALDEAAKIKYGQLPQKQETLTKLEHDWDKIPSEKKLIRDRVGAEDIASVVSRWTKVPVNKLLDSEAQKLASLEKELSTRVIGQEDAIVAVSNAIRRSRAGLSAEDKPIATFLFLGPTGVGKTETAKALANSLFDDEKSLIRIDMSEYGERHSVARLIGAPPGYVGYDEGGQLTESVRRRPYSIVLLDEVEKAHSDIFNIFLQIFDDGRLTDGKGRTVDFRNTVIIMTSNLASKLISQHQGKLEKIQDQVWDVLKEKFPPEFINRIDQIIIYDKLTTTHMEHIVDLELAKIKHRLDQKDISLKVDSSAKSYLAKQGYDPHFGARPLKRVIQNQILDHLALLITQSKIKAKQTVSVTLSKSSKLNFKISRSLSESP